MKKSSIMILQMVVVLLGLGAATLLLWEPQLEGRNVGASLFQIYFKDPFLVVAYTFSIAFFAGLYQAFMLLGHIGRNEVFSQRSVERVRTIKYCATILVVFFVGCETLLFLVQRGKDDIAGGVFIGLLMIFVFGVAATAATVLEKTLQSAVDLKSENDLTV